MKHKLAIISLGIISAVNANAQDLYFVKSDVDEEIPLRWNLGTSVIYDDNILPGNGSKESSYAINPNLTASYVGIAPQTTVELFARLGMIYYFDSPDQLDQNNSQSRLTLNVAHRLSERLSISSQNFASYELEPDYSYGYANTRVNGEYLFFQLNNSVAYRWTERSGTYTGLSFSGTDYDQSKDNDRMSWQAYNEYRYQFSPQTVFTLDYRYRETTGSGIAADSNDQFFLVGADHRLTENTIAVVRGGYQHHKVKIGDSNNSPYLELGLNSKLTQAWSVRSFCRYGIETNDTVQAVDNVGLVEFDDRRTVRAGFNTDYVFNPLLTVFAGVDYIPTKYDSARNPVNSASLPIGSLNEDVVNAHLGFTLHLTDNVTATAAYNYTDFKSDLSSDREFERNRVSLGLNAAF